MSLEVLNIFQSLLGQKTVMSILLSSFFFGKLKYDSDRDIISFPLCLQAVGKGPIKVWLQSL